MLRSLCILLLQLTLVTGVVEEGIVKFTRLYTDSNGDTHLKDCTVQAMEKKLLPGGESPQYVRDLGDIATGVTLTQMSGDNPWHQCPTSQFVIVLDGAWFVNATSGDYIEMGPGHVLYQDDYKGLEVNGGFLPMHYSGSVGEEPCNQMIISAAGRDAVVDDISCNWVSQFV
ncbi:hypothetical protein TrLO_g7761 [Triparma laevis f. longispina]|uniref:Uncharacterized protein n=1 Tax=Triparma laevis f. longispina TaxID=1714387 RepID=A0A9W7FFT3_9STRA|nr:hypothetical protein TrLO_g7761 [Triparma laevis f. longispina]